MLLDTDILIDLARQYPPAVEWFGTLRLPLPRIPGFAVLELLTGCQNAFEMKRMQRLIIPFRVYWPTPQDCNRAIRTYARGYLSHRLDANDALIAECAIGLGIPLCTFNTKHFRAVSGLTTIQPYEKR